MSYKEEPLQTFSASYQFSDYVGNSSTSDLSFSYRPLSTQGSTIPDFYKKVRDGELLAHTNFYQKEVLSVASRPYSYTSRRTSNPNQYWVHSGDCLSARPLPGIYHAIDSSQGQQLVQAAAAAIYQSGFDALTATAEFGDVLRIFNRIPKRLPDIIRKIRHLSKRDLQEAWLTGRYGLRPLAYDIMDLNDAIQNFDSSRKIYSERAGYSYTDTTTLSGSWNDITAGVGYYTTTYVTEHSVRGAVTARIEPARFIVNPLQTGWELVPFSFVLDWFYGVGQAIAAAGMRFNAKQATASIGIQSTTICTQTAVDSVTPKSDRTVTIGGGGSFTWAYQTTSRDPTPIPKMPQVKNNPLDLYKVIDLAFIANLRGRSLKR